MAFMAVNGFICAYLYFTEGGVARLFKMIGLAMCARHNVKFVQWYNVSKWVVKKNAAVVCFKLSIV